MVQKNAVRAKEDLFQLIKAMSKSEKRYFSLDAKKSGKDSARYLKLFQEINKMEEYTDIKLKKKYKNLSSDKGYLYEAILRSMRDYRSAKSKAAQVKERLMDSEYLYERGLYRQAQSRLGEAKALARELEDVFTLLKINVDEMQFFVDTKRQIGNEEFERLNLEKEGTLNNISEEMKYLDLYFQLSIKTIQEHEIFDEKNKQIFQKGLESEILSIENTPTSFKGKHRFFQCNAMFYRLLGEVDKVSFYFEKVVNLWDNFPALKQEEFHRYIIDVSNLINSFYKLKNLDNSSIKVYQDKLNKEKKNASFHSQQLIFRKISIANLLYHLNQNDFESAEEILPEIIIGIDQFNLKNSIVLVGNVMTVYFLVGDFEKCLFWCDKIIENKKLKDRKDVQRITRIYKLICLLELDLVEELDAYFRVVSRFFKLNKINEDFFEYNILNTHLKKIINLPLSELKKQFIILQNYLLSCKDKVGSNTPVGLEELLIWALKKT